MENSGNEFVFSPSPQPELEPQLMWDSIRVPQKEEFIVDLFNHTIDSDWYDTYVSNYCNLKIGKGVTLFYCTRDDCSYIGGGTLGAHYRFENRGVYVDQYVGRVDIIFNSPIEHRKYIEFLVNQWCFTRIGFRRMRWMIEKIGILASPSRRLGCLYGKLDRLDKSELLKLGITDLDDYIDKLSPLKTNSSLEDCRSFQLWESLSFVEKANWKMWFDKFNQDGEFIDASDDISFLNRKLRRGVLLIHDIYFDEEPCAEILVEKSPKGKKVYLLRICYNGSDSSTLQVIDILERWCNPSNNTKKLVSQFPRTKYWFVLH